MSFIKKGLFIFLSIGVGFLFSILAIILIDKTVLPFLDDAQVHSPSFKYENPSVPSQIHFPETTLILPTPQPKYTTEEIAKLLIPDGPGIVLNKIDQDTIEKTEDLKWFYTNEILGRTIQSKAVARHQLISKNDVIFNVTYHTDEFARRITPIEHPENREKFLAFFGCSFTYGYGVEDNQTLPYYVGKKLNDYYPLNYGVPGSSINYALALLQNRDLRKEISQKNGIGIYMYMDDHLERIIGTSFWSTLQPDSAYYYLDGDQVIRNGNFKTGRPIRTFLYKKLFESNYRKKFNLKYPLRPADDDKKLACSMLEQLQKEFLKQFPASKFYVGFYPQANRDFDSITTCLIKKNVRFLDLRNAYELT
ncbi:MAG: hypothetical protein K2Q18_01985, partial [Bdellovibrionales bacterium]|nr:hypothetical protein [Bdellovibrionales bacterium]